MVKDNVLTRHIFTLIFAVFVSLATFGGNKYAVSSMGIERGLSSNFVVDMEQDKSGFIWIATEEGLNRFDGVGFHTYYKSKAYGLGLTGNELNCLLDDAEEPLMWIGTQRFGLNAYNYATGTFTHYRHNPDDNESICTDDVTSLHHATDGNLWIATYWGGVDLFDKKGRRFVHYNSDNVEGMPDNSTWCAYDDGYGKLYIGHVRSGLSVMDVRTRKATNYRHSPTDPTSLAGDEVTCVYRDKAGRVWVGTNRGLDIFNPQTGAFTHFTDEGRLRRKISDIREMSDGRLWVATELGGVVAIDTYTMGLGDNAGNNGNNEYITTGKGKASISGNSVRCLLQDKYNNVWMGLYGEGICFLTMRQPLFEQITYSEPTTPYSLTTKAVLGVGVDSDGRLWAGTDGDGVNVFGRDGQRLRVIRTGGTGSVQAIFTDSRGQVWLGCFADGAYVCSDDRVTKVALPNDRDDVRAFHEDGQGRMWIATSNGVCVVGRDSKQALGHYDVGNNLVRTIASDSEGRLWIGTFGDGLFVFSPSMQLIRQFRTADGFPSNTVNQAIADRKGRMWICSGEGLVCFTDTKGLAYTVYDRDSGLENVHIRAVAEDAQGNIWASTYRSVSCLRDGQRQFLNWSYKDNLPLGNFSAASVATAADGTMYFGSNGGVCCFDPKRVLERRESPPPLVTRLTVYDQPEHRDSVISVVGKEAIDLGYRQNTFSVGFSTLDFSLLNEVEFCYKLDHLQKDWTMTADNEIAFRNVPPGHYRLLIRSRLRNQEWNAQTAVVGIVVATPLWLSWWAKLIYAACIVVVAWLILRAYNRNIRLRYLYKADKKSREQEQRLNNERMQFYTNITHELRTPLTLIIGPLEDLMEDQTLTASVRGKVAVVRNSAMRLNNLVSRILEFRKMETGSRKLLVGRGNIVAVIREICSKFVELNSKDDVELVFKPSQEIINVYFDREVINIIIDNLVSNAMKYTERGRIVISVSIVDGGSSEGQLLEIAVSDTGHGISAEALPHVFDRYYQEGGPHQASGTGIGLSLVKSMVTLHQGTIEAESKAGVGSVFRVHLKLEETYSDARHQPDTTDGASTPTSPTPSAAPMGTERRQVMLIVEDNQDICHYIADSFSDKFEIVTARDGHEGLKAAFQTVPDIIISDIMMPNMDGTEMCRKLKSDVRTSHIPIILLTAKNSTESKEEGYTSGADSFITKPFVRSLIASRVENLLRQRQLLAKTYEEREQPSHNMEQKRAILREALGKMDRDFLERIDSLINESIKSDSLDIDYLAESMNISASTLYRKMKALTGLSTNEYIRKYRMTRAESLLLEGKYTIQEVGYMVGMNTTAYFRKCFKDEFGETPSEYIAMVKKTGREREGEEKI